MTTEGADSPKGSLGEFLRASRIEKQKTVEELSQQTRIPATLLRAMEADDHAALPAPGFSRGHYGIYAKALGLEPQAVYRWFDQEVSGAKISKKRHHKTPHQDSDDVESMAARPSRVAWSISGTLILLVIILAAVTCWYFSWNPATFISERLRSLQGPLTQEKQVKDPTRLFPLIPPESDDVGEMIQYFLTIEFLEDTTITVSVDHELPEEGIYKKGSTRSWYGNRSINVTLPADATVEIYFNGNHIPLPQPAGNTITIKLP